MVLMYMYFFFQAEDGIRDIGVTGVQTCALPISEVGQVPAAAFRNRRQTLYQFRGASRAARGTPRRGVQGRGGSCRPPGGRERGVEGKGGDFGGGPIL